MADVGCGMPDVTERKPHRLSPRWVRLLVFIAMFVVALLAIVLIDRRAMIRMHEIGAGYTAPAEAVTP